MNPIVINLGPLQVRAFTFWIALAAAITGVLALGTAAQRRERLMPWLDTLVGAVVGGVIGARAGHVLLNWGYFAAHQDEILSISGGGLNWHGALLGGLVGAALVARVRRVSLPALMDAFALALPVCAVAIWQGCAAAACGYGLEVRTLADYPSWLVTESPDVFGTIAPRLALPTLGTLLALVVLLLVIALYLLRWLRGLRLWVALMVYGLCMALLSPFRGEYVPLWWGRRADQILDLSVALLAALIFASVALFGKKTVEN